MICFRITLQSNSKWLIHNIVSLSSTRRDHVRSPTRSNLRVLRYRSTKWWLCTRFCCSWIELLMRLFFTTSSLYSYLGDYKTAVKLCLKPDIATWQITRALLAYSFSCLRKHTEAMAIAHSLIEVLNLLLIFVSTVLYWNRKSCSYSFILWVFLSLEGRKLYKIINQNQASTSTIQ